MKITTGGRKGKRNVGFKIPKKKFRFCVRDEYGTKALAEQVMFTVRSPLDNNNEFLKKLRKIKAHECNMRGDNAEKTGSLSPIIMGTLRLVSKRHED
uniref:Uncharacterized protein n=1 Tax=Oryza glumipatula TaxID=40148 RepID=A0A0D9ZMQ6_9ORYZ